MSENSLILLPSAKISNEDLANCNSYSSESQENSNVTPDSLFKLIRRCSGMEKTSVFGDIFNNQIIKRSSNLSTDISSKETSEEMAPELPMKRFCSTDANISAKEMEVMLSQAPSKEFSLKRFMNLSTEGESEASLEKRVRVSTEEVGTGELGKENCIISPPMLPITQDIQFEAASEGTMLVTEVKTGVSYNENISGQRADKEAVIFEAIITIEKSRDVPTAGSWKMSQSSSSVSDQPENKSSTDFDKEKKSDEYFEGKACSICGNTNCPFDANRALEISPISMPQMPLFGKLKSSRKSKQYQLNVMMAKNTKTPTKRYINTRSSTNRLAKRIANHTPLHVFKLKGQLFKAVEDGDMVKVQELIQDTGSAVRKNKTRCTLLHAAASHNQPDVVMFLLKCISPNVTNKEGQTPAHVAAEKGHTQVLSLLVRDSDFEADKRDNRHNTVKSLLGGHLFKPILEGNKKEAERLVELGADPDNHGGKLMNGLLARELGVTTPRLLANALNMEWAVTMFAKKARDDETVETGFLTSAASNSVQLKVPTRQFHVRHATAIQGGADVYKMDKEARGFVGIFNFSSFEDRSDLNLQQLDYDARIMSDVFDNMGYKCKTHSSLTAQQTKEVLKNIRDADELTGVGCAIFVISGYSVNGRNFLTSDMKSVDIDYILNLFKDSECPQLKDKPKLFIFNLYKLSEVITTSSSETLKMVRLTDPLNDMAYIYSNNIGLNCIPNGKGTAFNWCLCRTLAEHAADQEFCDFYREFLKYYNESSPTFSPELRYFGFTKKFFFNPM